MSLAALMVHVTDDDACEPRLRLAGRLANRLDAALIGVGAEAFVPPPDAAPWSYAAGAVAEAVDEQIAAELAGAEQRFRSICADVRKGLEWRAETEAPARALARHARAADLIIAGVRRDNGGPMIEREADVADLVMGSGRPVLSGPADADELEPKRIVLAWKDAREARRAAADALPLMRAADQVVVVQSPEPGQEDPTIALADVAEALRRHGVAAKVRVLPSDRPAADAILESSVEADAQLIVAGAYGRPRFSEWVFGGVTQSLLRQKAKFVLLSH